ncbi:MAG: hypothetical protein WDN06_05550 [Asticcacaulis sp.]
MLSIYTSYGQQLATNDNFGGTTNAHIDVSAWTHGTADATLVHTTGGNTVIDFGGGNTITVASASQADVMSHIVW